MHWRRYWMGTLGGATGLVALLYALVLVIDPFDTVWFSPPFDREPISTNQRYSYPALARKARFDSAVFGSSSTRLLRPAKLDATVGGSFVNLSMNSDTAYEQSRILAVFLRHHPMPKTVVLGIDSTVWCVADADKFTPRPFPPWMYDDDRWNDLAYLFNDKALENAVRMLELLRGVRQAKYQRNGYRDFLPAPQEYDLEKVRREIYAVEHYTPGDWIDI